MVDSLSLLYKEKKMSDEASVLKIKRRRNFLNRQMKVSTVKEKLRNAFLSKFAWKIRAAAYSPVKKFQILRDKLAWLEVVDWRIQKHRSSSKTKRWFSFFIVLCTPTGFELNSKTSTTCNKSIAKLHTLIMFYKQRFSN